MNTNSKQGSIWNIITFCLLLYRQTRCGVKSPQCLSFEAKAHWRMCTLYRHRGSAMGKENSFSSFTWCTLTQMNFRLRMVLASDCSASLMHSTEDIFQITQCLWIYFLLFISSGSWTLLYISAIQKRVTQITGTRLPLHLTLRRYEYHYIGTTWICYDGVDPLVYKSILHDTP